MSRYHDWDHLTHECRKCGITAMEHCGAPKEDDPMRPPCTGNAYICRVARKLASHPLRHGEPWGYFPQPWEMTGAALVVLILRILNDPNGPPDDTLEGLFLAVPDDPGRLAFVADRLEENGCEDSALLSALRTT